MDDTQIKHVVEAALLAAGRPLTLDRLLELFTKKGAEPDRAAIRRALDALSADYEARGVEIKEVASGFRIQVKRTMSDWLAPLWEERAPRYTRALLETLALVAYRQPITRAEIEEVRGVVVSTNIVRTLLERNWIRVVGHRDVPGKPAMFGTTREFLDYFGLKRLEDLPPLAEIKDNFPELSPQADLIESLDTGPHLTIVGDEDTEAAVEHEPAPAASAETGDAAPAEEAAVNGDEAVSTALGAESDVPAQWDVANAADVPGADAIATRAEAFEDERGEATQTPSLSTASSDDEAYAEPEAKLEAEPDAEPEPAPLPAEGMTSVAEATVEEPPEATADEATIAEPAAGETPLAEATSGEPSFTEATPSFIEAMANAAAQAEATADETVDDTTDDAGTDEGDRTHANASEQDNELDDEREALRAKSPE